MSIIVIAITSIVALILLHWLYHLLTKPSNLPPGPFPLPIIGNVHLLYNNDPWKTFRELNRKYGPVATIHIGHSTRLLIFLEADVIFDVFTGRETAEVVADRPEITALPGGIAWAGWPAAAAPRRFTLRCFREFGLTQSATALAAKGAHIQDEVATFCSFIESVSNQPIDVTASIRECVANCIMLPVYGHRLDMNDNQTRLLYAGGIKFFDSTLADVVVGQLLGPLSLIVQNHFVRGQLEMTRLFKEWLQNEINQRKPTFRQDQPMTDFIDCYMAAEERQDNSSDKMTLESFARTLADLFLGGMETLGQLSKWSLMYFAHYPEWQEKVQAEIDEVVGSSMMPGLEHRSKLVFLQAFLNEVYRHCGFAVIAISHRASKDFSFTTKGNAYSVPEGTPVMYSMNLANEDKGYWGDPDNFRPERWLTEDDPPALKHYAKLIFFGVGKRVCVGEAAARAILYLTVAAVLQRFSFRLAKFVPLTACEMKINRNPPPFELIFSPRN